MATEKILIFDEAGNAKRMKVRIARFLDNEPVTASDKENIRTTLDVDGSQSGTFTTPLSVTSASDSSFTGGGKVGVGTSSPSAVLEATGAGTGGRGLKITETSTSKTSGVYTLEVDSSAHGSNMSAAGAMKIDVASGRALTVDGQGRVGIGTASPSYELDVQAANARIAATSGAGVVNHLQADATGAWVGPLSNHDLYFKTNNTIRWTINTSGNLVASSGKGIDFGSGASTTLDDYEEGYHETTVGTDGTGSITLYASHDRMTYTKIGNLIQINGMFAITSVSSPTGNVTFSLPVAVPTLTDNAGYVGGAVYFQDYGNSNTAVPFRCDPGTSTMTIFVDSSTLAANDKFAFNFTYRTTAS